MGGPRDTETASQRHTAAGGEAGAPRTPLPQRQAGPHPRDRWHAAVLTHTHTQTGTYRRENGRPRHGRTEGRREPHVRPRAARRARRAHSPVLVSGTRRAPHPRPGPEDAAAHRQHARSLHSAFHPATTAQRTTDTQRCWQGAQTPSLGLQRGCGSPYTERRTREQSHTEGSGSTKLQERPHSTDDAPMNPFAPESGKGKVAMTKNPARGIPGCDPQDPVSPGL